MIRMTNRSFIMTISWILLAILAFVDAKSTLTHEIDDRAGTIRVTLQSDCGLLGVSHESFVPGAQGGSMRIQRESFVSSDDQRHFSITVDVQHVPADEIASIGFSSYGVVDQCTNEMLALVDPLVFRLSSRHEGGRRLFIIEVGMDFDLVFPPNTVVRPNISIASL